jgi:hypothetical protein
VDFVLCTLAVEKKKKSGQVSTCRIGPFPCQFILTALYVLTQLCRWGKYAGAFCYRGMTTVGLMEWFPHSDKIYATTMTLHMLFVPAELKGKGDNTNGYLYNVIQ